MKVRIPYSKAESSNAASLRKSLKAVRRKKFHCLKAGTSFVIDENFSVSKGVGKAGMHITLKVKACGGDARIANLNSAITGVLSEIKVAKGVEVPWNVEV